VGTNALKTGPAFVVDRVILLATMVVTLCTSAPIWIGALANDTTPLGLSPNFWLYVSVGFAAAGLVATFVIAAFQQLAAKYAEGGKFGITTYTAIGLGILSLLPTLMQNLDEATKPLNIDPQLWATATVIIGLATTVGKAFQAAVVGYNRFRSGVTTMPPPSGGGGTGGGVPPVVNPTTPPDTPEPGSSGDLGGGKNDPTATDEGDAGPDGLPEG
jgi:hypothetical protein